MRWKLNQAMFFPPDQHNSAIVAFLSCVPNMTDSEFNVFSEAFRSLQ